MVNATEYRDRLINVQIQNAEKLIVARSDPWNPLPRHDAALWQPRVVALRLGHLNGTVLQIEEDFDRSHLVRRLVDFVQRLLEVGMEAQHLFVVDQPRRQEWALVGRIEGGQFVWWTVWVRNRGTANARPWCGG